MGRAGWAAMGALGAAAVVASPAVVPAPVAVAVLAGVLLGLRATGARHSPAVRTGVTALLIATGVVGIRGLLAAGPPTGAIPDGSGPWEAVIVALGSPSRGDQRATLRLVEPGEHLVAARLPRYPGLIVGDRVSAAGRLRARPDSDYGRYLERTGVAATLDARSLELMARPTDPTTRIESIRRASADALALVLPEPEAGLAAGILLGLRDRVDRELAAAFTTAGVSHVVAISGWNIAIVAGIIGAVAARLSRRRRVVITLAVVAAYVLLVGTSPSVVRAALMAGIVMVARESGRAGRAAAALGWTVVVLLVVEPAMLLDAGFQLSALATAGLLAWGRPLTGWIDRRTGGRLPRWLCESLGISLAAQAATLPVVVGTFGRLALVAPAVNLALAPLVPVAMAGGLAALVAGWVATVTGPLLPASIAGTLGWIPLALLDMVVTTAARLPFASLTLDPPMDVAAALGTAGALAAVIARERLRRAVGLVGRGAGAAAAGATRGATAATARGSGSPAAITTAPPASNPPGASRRRPARARLGFAAVAALAIAAWAIGAAQPGGIPTVTVLDVGQGDAILVEGGHGARALVDGGPDPERLLRALDGRLPAWDRRLDLLILTHPHEDHVAGFPVVLDRYRVGRVLVSGLPGDSPGYEALVERIADNGVPHGSLAAGDRVTLDDVTLVALWPDPGSVPAGPLEDGSSINDTSVVLLGEAAGRRFLLTGDVEAGVEAILAGRGIGPVDLLKVGHHGSDTSSTPAFLEALDPAVAVISVGADNDYGHPSPGVIDRLASGGSLVYRTDLDGTVEVELAPDAVRVRAEHGPARRAGVALGYHRLDARAQPYRGSPPAAPPRSPTLVPATHEGRRRDRGLARPAHRASRGSNRSPPGRDRGSAARRGQARATLRSRSPAGARRGVGGLARAARLRRARSGGGLAPGDPARRRPRVRDLVVGGVVRGAGRRLRRQASGPAPRDDGRPLCLVAAALPRDRG